MRTRFSGGLSTDSDAYGHARFVEGVDMGGILNENTEMMGVESKGPFRRQGQGLRGAASRTFSHVSARNAVAKLPSTFDRY